MKTLNDYVESALRPSRILLLEDDASSAGILQKTALEFNCELLWEKDQDGAEALLRSTKLDLAFLDIRLVRGSGLGVFRMMRREGIDIPVCFLSAYLSVQVIEEVNEIGVAAIMLKPIDFSVTSLSRYFRTFGIKPAAEQVNPT